MGLAKHKVCLKSECGKAVTNRLSNDDWPRLEAELDHYGHALLPKLLQPDEYRMLIAARSPFDCN